MVRNPDVFRNMTSYTDGLPHEAQSQRPEGPDLGFHVLATPANRWTHAPQVRDGSGQERNREAGLRINESIFAWDR